MRAAFVYGFCQKEKIDVLCQSHYETRDLEEGAQGDEMLFVIWKFQLILLFHHHVGSPLHPLIGNRGSPCVLRQYHIPSN